jgi:hypothetical protein
MEICKNKKTGRTFVCLDQRENGKALMITPQGAVKVLEFDLFTKPVVDDGKKLAAEGQINQNQYKVYNLYHQK